MMREGRGEAYTAGLADRPLGTRARLAVVIVAGLAIATGLANGLGFLESAPYGVVGGLLSIRRPRHPVGWLLLIGAWAFSLSSITVPASAAQFGAGAVPPPVLAVAVAQAWSGSLFLAVLLALTLVFPGGRLSRGRWGTLARVALGLVVLLTLLALFAPTISVTMPGSSSGTDVPNPLAAFPGFPLWPAVSAGPLATLGLVAAGVISMLVRLGRARGVERAQLRWVVWSMAFIVVGFVIGLVGDAVFHGQAGVVWLPAIVAFSLPPVAIGIAILRYRLYEIDRLVSRTISWALVSAIVGGLFVGSILVLQAVLAPVTQSNTVAVAGSTLVVFSLFQPLRRRVQRIVDRRFNRARVDADGIVAAFAGRLRDEVDLGKLGTEITSTVAGTVQPVSVGLWLRG